MTRITILKPKQDKADELTVETVVRLESSLRRVSKLRYDKNELYFIPTTHKKGKPGIELHMSYHASGEIHSKLIGGKLRQATARFEDGKTEPPKIETLGEAIPTEKDTEITLWKKRGTPLNLIRGAQEIFADNPGVQSCSNIAETAKGYPILQKKSKADYIFEINVQPTPWIDVKYFFVEPGNVDILEERVKSVANSWNNIRSNLNLPRPKFKYLEKAVLFVNLNPWLCIALFRLSDDAKSSESFLSGQPTVVKVS